MKPSELDGIFIPNVTPFARNGEINENSLSELIEFWLDKGVSGIVVNASTGEAPMLSRKERRTLISLVLDKVNGRGKVVAGTGAVGTKETITLSRDAEDIGVDALLVTTPYFFKPSEEEVQNHFKALSDEIETSLILYNVPKFTGYSVSPRIIEKISNDCPSLIGLKDSSGNLGDMAETLRLVGKKINVLSGSADLVLPTLAMGGNGAILAVANVIPEIAVKLFESASDGDLKKSGQLQLLVSYANKVLVRDRSQIAAIKAALKIRGYQPGIPRNPFKPASEKDKSEIEKMLKGLNLT